MKKSKVEKVNKQTGLTRSQEQAAQLIAEGKPLEECSEEIGVTKSVIYEWQSKPTFQAYFNRLSLDLKQNTTQGLFGLYNDALQAIRDSLQSENESIRLKVAMYIVEKLEKREIGETDVRIMLRKQCTKSPLKWDFPEDFDEGKYEALLEENNLSQ